MTLVGMLACAGGAYAAVFPGGLLRETRSAVYPVINVSGVTLVSRPVLGGEDTKKQGSCPPRIPPSHGKDGV